jgi:S-DNA-T family DNA segregation ATPase FtsK/SpoIIIE
MKKKVRNGTVNAAGNGTVRNKNKKRLLGLFLILFSIFSFLSLISYSRYDLAVLNYKFSDLLKVFNPGDEFRGTNNFVGIVGAYLSDFFINNTIGIFCGIFPVIIFVLGFSFIKKISFRLMIRAFNFLIIAGLILSGNIRSIRFYWRLFR